MLTLQGVPRPEHSSSVSLESLVAGFSFVWGHPIILPALALDLFAVLLGGATSLLPIFAKDILRVGVTGLGWLDAAPALGAMTMAVFLAHRPPLKHAGRDLLRAVAGFGLATVVFGLSQNFFLSLLMLFCTGAVDNISVIVRHYAGADADPRRDARPRVSRQRHVHRRVERTGGLRVGNGSVLFLAADFRRLRRRGNASGRRRGGPVLHAIAALRAARRQFGGG